MRGCFGDFVNKMLALLFRPYVLVTERMQNR